MEDDEPIIKVTTPRSEKYDVKVDVYDSDPKEIIRQFIL